MEYIPSILLSVKKNLGIAQDYTHFDADILSHINSTMAVLFQEGVGPQDKPVEIKDDTYTWDVLTDNDPTLNFIQSSVFLRVKMLFDPPATTHVSQAMKESIAELEYRSMIAAEDFTIPPEVNQNG